MTIVASSPGSVRFFAGGDGLTRIATPSDILGTTTLEPDVVATVVVAGALVTVGLIAWAGYEGYRWWVSRPATT